MFSNVLSVLSIVNNFGHFHDMTAMERAECRKIVNDAKLQESNNHSGNGYHRV